MARYPRHGQKHRYGRTKKQILDQARELERQSSQYVGSAAGELASRDREVAAYLRECAERMSD